MAKNNISPLEQAKTISLSAGINIPDGIDSLSAFGDYLFQNSNWVNEFINAYCRIAFEVISSRVWENPLSFLFKTQNFGYSIEELFINTARPLAYDPWGKGEEQWERVMPDVRKFMHLVNVKTYVEQTVYDEGLRTAFTNEASWTQFRDQLVAMVTDGLNVALYKASKYMIALYCIETNAITYPIADYKTNPKGATLALQVLSNKLTFKSNQFNPAGVDNFCPKNRQYLIVTPEFDSTQSVEVLAYMFNIEMGELPQRKIMLDDLWNHDYNSLNQMFVNGVPHTFTSDEITALKNVPAMLIADDLLFFYKLFDRWGAPWNDKKLYWNYMHHWQGTMSYSPFACGVALYTGDSLPNTYIANPYPNTSLTVGRDNLFYLHSAYEHGGFANRVEIKGTVTGNALIAMEEYDGWYKAANTRGQTSTITYKAQTVGVDDLVITITTV